MRNSNAPEFKTLSQRAKQLLAWEEGFDVDFKRSVSGLEAEDIVAFANSKSGGAILIGVDESKNPDGRQIGIVVGCSVGDLEKRKILDKAHQCVPPVAVTVHVEDRRAKPFYRIEIPSGPNKPYCTSGGTYKTRGDGRKNTLYPTSLLSMFLETEGGEFLRRFQQATSTLQDSVENVKKQIVNDLGDLAGSVAQMEFNVDESLGRISGVTQSAEDNAMNANSYAEEAVHRLDQIYSMVESEDPTLNQVSEKLDAVLKHFQIEDPRITARKQWVKSIVGGITIESKNRGLDMRPSSIGKRAKRLLAKPGTVWYPELVREAVSDLPGSERAYLGARPFERGVIDFDIKQTFAKQKRPASRRRQPKRTMRRSG